MLALIPTGPSFSIVKSQYDKEFFQLRVIMACLFHSDFCSATGKSHEPFPEMVHANKILKRSSPFRCLSMFFVRRCKSSFLLYRIKYTVPGILDYTDRERGGSQRDLWPAWKVALNTMNF